MTESQALTNFAQVVEKIVFDENELEKLKIVIKNFTQGKTGAKELKKLLLECRGRMVDDMTDYVYFITKKLANEKNKEQLPISFPSKIESELKEEIKQKKELLELVAKRVNNLASKVNNDNFTGK